ncbi:uncharacterized protein N7498_007951 [Penicillium cinerascens]|uniref:Copper homeostasis protein cutC homolog n=1 Tax=Penicillium cinerascens TaxID=70096 RepID=A0A9W9MA65_9EURO|nr:uncharacterized protein N7498_007951 [Penicillium cinerascens]KAJ5194513.1 hypothetical protein N7498_007951 [Penicillium cinerascens]
MLRTEGLIESKPDSAGAFDQFTLTFFRLCCDYESGGLSPAATILTALKSQISIPIHVMIRPHSEGFCYNDESFEAMKTTLVALKNLGADGFVFGILGPVSESLSQDMSPWIDVSRNKELVQLAEGKPCTFHRAFDCIPESHWDMALADIAKCGFASILTSGGPSSDKAIDCVGKLAELGQRLDLLRFCSSKSCEFPEIIVGGG